MYSISLQSMYSIQSALSPTPQVFTLGLSDSAQGLPPEVNVD